MAFPWLPLAIVASSVLPSLFGKGRNQEIVKETEMPPRGYQSPMVGMLDPLLVDILLRNLRTWGGAGVGGQATGAYSPYVDQILKMLGERTFPQLMSGYGATPLTKKSLGGM